VNSTAVSEASPVSALQLSMWRVGSFVITNCFYTSLFTINGSTNIKQTIKWGKKTNRA